MGINLKVTSAGTRAADKNEVVLLAHEAAGGQLLNAGFVEDTFFPIKMDQIPVVWQPGGVQLVV